MKPNIWLSVFVTGCLFYCIACNSKNQLTVIHTNCDGEVEQQQNLEFEFNKDIYPDSLLEAWDSTAYVDFEPAVKGMFKWNSSSELEVFTALKAKVKLQVDLPDAKFTVAR